MEKIEKQKGVTLVALVVTIIVLIILAGISINLILGDNGIITIAKKAKENTELAKIEEETELNELYTQLETEGSSSGNLPYDSIAKLTEFKTAIANAIDEVGGIKPDITAETSVFADNIKGIVKEVTKNATATADNISEGKTAWVNGTLITGNGKDNESYKTDSEPLETYIVNSAYSGVAAVIKNDGNTIMNGSFSGEYFSVKVKTSSYWMLTALKDCEISYVSMKRESTTNTTKTQTVKTGDIINQTYDGITVIKVLK